MFHNSRCLTFDRAIYIVIIIVLMLGVSACGSATPTLPPTSPTPALPTQPPSGQPTVPPTATGVPPTVPALPTAGSPAVPTPTQPAPAAPTATRVIRPTATPVPATPKPAALSGRIAYSVVTASAPKFHTIWIANVDGTGARQVMTHARWPAFSPDGARIAYFGQPEGKSEGLYIANADGGNQQLAIAGSGICCINWSRDGNWIVYANSGKPLQPGGPIAMVKVDGAFKTIVDLHVQGNGPAFSPDGKQIVFSGCVPNTNTCGVMVAPADGSGAARTVTTDNGGTAHWSPDGKRIVYQATDGAGHRQIFVVNADGSGKKQLTAGTSNDGQPIWSRDGGAIFWRSDQNGTAWAIFVMNADGSRPRKIIADAPPDRDLWGWESLTLAP